MSSNALQVSPARLAANRANAQRSTGPRTRQGKSASSRNATSHGLFAKHPLLDGEDPAEYEALKERLVEEFAPASGIEDLLVDDIAGLLWRLKRLAKVEVALFSIGTPKAVEMALSEAGEAEHGVGAAFAAQAPAFGVLSRYEVTMANRLRRTLDDLRAMQSERKDATPALVVVEGGA
jgi:hypothetical protein